MRVKYLVLMAVLMTAVLGFGISASAQQTDAEALITQLQAQIQSLLQ